MAEKRIALIIALMIFLLTGINGIFTYSGAMLYIGEFIYALLFAIAVQFAISISLIALPYVKGLGKLVLIMVYLGATALSTLTAYTYIYNAGRADDDKNREITLVQVANLIETTALVSQLENRNLEKQYQDLQRFKREVEEEGSRGLRSGKGAGKGIVYYQKMEALDEQSIAYIQLSQNNKKLNDLLDQTEKKINIGKREALQIHISKIQQYTVLQHTYDQLEKLKKEVLNETKNPIQVALLALKNYKTDDIQLIVSFVWAAVFDLIALFLGIVRYYILRPNYSMFSVLYDAVLNFYLFISRISYAATEAKVKHQLQIKAASMKTPYNSAEIQNFASYLIAGANYSQKYEDVDENPVAYLLQNIEPLLLSHTENAVGIKMEFLEETPKIKPLVAMLIQSEIFKEDSSNHCLVLNSSNEMAQKVLIFLKLGLNKADKIGDLKLQLEALT